MLILSIIVIGQLIGLVPNQTRYELENREKLSDSLAVILSAMAAENDVNQIRSVLAKLVQSDGEILSAGFRAHSGELLFEIGSHPEARSKHNIEDASTFDVVPVYRKNIKLGEIELKFKPFSFIEKSWRYIGIYHQYYLYALIFALFANIILILQSVTKRPPSSVIPERVNAAFDTLSEGVAIIDDQEKIILANKVFSDSVKWESSKILGSNLSEFKWKIPDQTLGNTAYPWVKARSRAEKIIGELIYLQIDPYNNRALVVNCAPILDGQGQYQGLLLTFDDVTELELQKQKLQAMVADLESSQKAVQKQNKELQFLATRDPLTGCFNRRSFNEQFAVQFNQARASKEDLCCIMVDIDHFKQVNDNFGHSVGDEVLKFIADTLVSSTRDIDIVGRYGGEEFCIILPGLGDEEALTVAERIRLLIKSESVDVFVQGMRVTASMGVSSILDHAKNPAELNEQADQALYIAKDTGRNRVVRWTAASTQAEEQHAGSVKGIKILEQLDHDEEIHRLRTQIVQLEKATVNFSAKLQQENYDQLTGLPNQALFYDRIRQAVDRGGRQGKITAIMLIDLDLFSRANKNFSRSVADEMFIKLTKRLHSLFRATDSLSISDSDHKDLTISRFESDEIGVLLSDLDDRMVAAWAAKRAIDAMTQVVAHENKQFDVSCNIGISLFPDDAATAEELIGHAGTAKSFVRKDEISSGFHFFDPEMQIASLKQIALESEIRCAVKHEQWILFYQPKMDIITGEIKSVECLVRWNHPTRGLLGPFDFIELAEQRGLILDIGSWVTRTACIQAKKWADAGYEIKVAVNISAIQLRQKNFPDKLLDIVNETQIDPHLLELEVTETILMDNVDMVVKHLNRLHCRGISISLDDFGTGYSSLGYLKHLPIDTLKIDRVFIKDIVTDAYDNNIVKTIISMAHGMQIKVVAEGVETQEQFKLLQELSCDEIQGYILSKPVDADSATELLNKGKNNVLQPLPLCHESVSD